MVPALEPGDRVIVLWAPVRAGDVVAVRDPRHTDRIMIKRATSIGSDGAVDVAGDNAAESTDSRTFGHVPAELVLGRVVYRYAPAARAGFLSGRRRWRRWRPTG